MFAPWCTSAPDGAIAALRGSTAGSGTRGVVGPPAVPGPPSTVGSAGPRWLKEGWL